MRRNTLEEKVFMENEIIKIRNQVGKKAKKYFEQYRNQKIIKTNDELLKKIKENKDFKQLMNEQNYTVKPLQNGHATLTLFLTHKYDNLMINVKICFNGGKYEDNTYYCIYLKEVIYIGETEEQVLKRLDENKPYQLIDYSEQKKIIDEYHKQKEKLKEIERNINHRLTEFKD